VCSSDLLRKNALPPIYGESLYDSIGNAKIVVNIFTNHNGLYKDNMRTYETIGCGALMIAQDGVFPKAFEPDVDFLTFRNSDELYEKIDYVLSLPDQGRSMALKARDKLMRTCSKEVQWNEFKQLINSIQ
jgi:spore maturation protein CgeB